MSVYLIFLYALMLGSFFNVVGLRVPLKESIIRPRSACPGCSRSLSAYELIPVISYVIQAGKCRHCKQRISLLYPLVELSTALLFVFAFIKLGWSFELVIAWILISLLMIIFVSDFTYMLIPDKILLVFIGIFFAIRLISPLSPWWDSLAGAAIGFFLIYAIAIVSNGGMGGGDIKLFGLLGFLLGTKLVLMSFIISSLIGAIVSLIGLATGVLKKGKPIPYGPFIGIAALIVYFFHQPILDWYFSF